MGCSTLKSIRRNVSLYHNEVTNEEEAGRQGKEAYSNVDMVSTMP